MTSSVSALQETCAKAGYHQMPKALGRVRANAKSGTIPTVRATDQQNIGLQNTSLRARCLTDTGALVLRAHRGEARLNGPRVRLQALSSRHLRGVRSDLLKGSLTQIDEGITF